VVSGVTIDTSSSVFIMAVIIAMRWRLPGSSGAFSHPRFGYWQIGYTEHFNPMAHECQ
jgi:hypothetical protein